MNFSHRTPIQISPKRLSLARTLENLLRKEESGAALSECYGDEAGAKNWAYFVKNSNPSIQYTFQSEVNTINGNGASIASLVASDPDIDTSCLIIIEKGGGSREALQSKSFKIMEFFQEAGINVALYSNWERSSEYRMESEILAKTLFPSMKSKPLDVDFNKEDPDLSAIMPTSIGLPRVVVEFGSSRSNIPTTASDNRNFSTQTYVELRKRFSHDRKICRSGGILIIGCDANQDESARSAYLHPAHAKFAENIVYRGSREGVLTENFNPQLFFYDPVWDKDNHVIKHTLVATADQDFGILSMSGDFRQASIKENDQFVLSHSIKWPEDKMIMAAESEGFKCLGVYWSDDRRIPIYVFKAIPVVMHPALSIVK